MPLGTTRGAKNGFGMEKERTPARVLVIEDHPASLDLMTYLLHAFGHMTLTACDGTHGVETARRETPDVIICDVHLPTMDGYQVARLLKADAALSRIPLIAVTALAMVGDRAKVLAAGFDGYITKPIAPEVFVAQVEALLPLKHRSVPHPVADVPAAVPTKVEEVSLADSAAAHKLVE